MPVILCTASEPVSGSVALLTIIVLGIGYLIHRHHMKHRHPTHENIIISSEPGITAEEQYSPPIPDVLRDCIIRNPGMKLASGEACLFRSPCLLADDPGDISFTDAGNTSISSLLPPETRKIPSMINLTNRRYYAYAENMLDLPFYDIGSVEGFSDGIVIITEASQRIVLLSEENAGRISMIAETLADC